MRWQKKVDRIWLKYITNIQPNRLIIRNKSFYCCSVSISVYFYDSVRISKHILCPVISMWVYNVTICNIQNRHGMVNSFSKGWKYVRSYIITLYVTLNIKSIFRFLNIKSHLNGICTFL